ncbi:putative secreted protein [Propionispora sp. 2/2-37]|uniref:LPP20 family lipoprotein n=1 Tax=Propionispora sp. 2/2-37 TaxID=1677858 RepID=UPI0006BB94B9|nr:LPP20 family lipoprotein [Propionispora sp. 2/2-37]CUH95335.1 putative secreted protein [Propionispora sp. 2/2-37]
MRKIWMLTILLMTFFSMFTFSFAANSVSFEQGTIEATGIGLPPSGTYGTQGTALAKRAAIVDAYRNLAEIIQGVQVNSTTTIHNLQIESDVVQTKVSSLIQGAKIVGEAARPDGSYQVTMQLPMYGSNSLAAVVYPAIMAEKAPEPLPAPSSPAALSNSQHYTGVIVDARGLGLEPTFSPGIYDESGRHIYGHKYIDADYAIQYGMVEYTINDAMYAEAVNGKARAGSSPLIVRAVGIKDRCNVIISVEEADKIISASQADNFLARCAVVFSR